MSFSRSGPKPIANSVGKSEFGKWYLHSSSIESDAWKKPLLTDQGYDRADEYIRIIRYNIDIVSKKFEYSIFFTYEVAWLREQFKNFQPIYEDHLTRFEFNDIQAAKDYIDKFIERLNNLLVFS